MSELEFTLVVEQGRAMTNGTGDSVYAGRNEMIDPGTTCLKDPVAR